ncbi:MULTISPECIES: META domain-containing protein [unclassified Streptomyces]|uniref:META domain-containing protein n=1 Tax=unclassified Streptomyces TaxID=2593676 RepID=UPI0035DAD8EE
MVLGVLVSLLALTSCGTERGDGSRSGAGSGGAVRTELPVTGIRWGVDSVTVDGKRTAAPADAHVEIDAKGRASGNYGCNLFTADVRVDGETLTVGPATSTERGCEKDVQRFETVMSRAFSGELTAAVADRKLTLTSADGDSIALTSQPPAPLTGTTWTVTSLVSGSDASSLPAGTEGEARIVFGKDGSVHGSFGCNGFRGRATVSGSTITFDSVDSTKMMCPDPRMKLERAVLAVLDGKTTYRIDHRSLSLTAENGEGIGASAMEKTPTGGTAGTAG